MCTGKLVVASSWKLDSSRMFQRSSVEPSTIASNGVPRLPPVRASQPAERKMWPMSDVVVVLPFVPVTPMTGPRRNSAASSNSPMTATPLRRASARAGRSQGTPGDGMIKSCSVKSESG